MKRIGNVFEKICSTENLIDAHKHASKGKGWYGEVIDVNKNPEEYLRILQGMLINKTYETSEYVIFQRKDGIKLRTIYKLPYFPDRICQWSVIQTIEPTLIKTLIRETYSAIPGRGTHQCLGHIKKAIENDPNGTKYCLKMDIRHYYPSINHEILKSKFRKLFKDPDLLWLLDEIIESVPPEQGVPIGNYMSQYCGNLYLSDYDHWLKETEFKFKGKIYKVQYYYRYMDDMVILSDSKEFLHWLRKEIETHLYKNLKVSIKNSWQVFPIADRGIDFIGYRIFPKFTLVRKRNVKNMKNSVKVFIIKLNNGGKVTYSDYCSLNSFKGVLNHADTFRLGEKYLSPLTPKLNEYHEKNLKNSGKSERGAIK